MSSIQHQDDHQPQYWPDSPPPDLDESQGIELQTTSFVLNSLPPEQRPTQQVACMTCPLANWMLRGKSVEAYCRMLYLVVWETATPGKILRCDAPEQARLAALEAEDPPITTRPRPEVAPAPTMPTTLPTQHVAQVASAPVPEFNEDDPFGMANLPATGGKGFL